MAAPSNSSDEGDVIVESASVKSGTSWIPLILVLLFIPLSSYLLTSFVVIPQLRAALVEPGEGAALKQGSRDANQPAFFHDISGVVVNVAGTMGTRYLRVSFRVAGSDPGLDALLRQNRAPIMDVVIATLSTRTMPELEESGGRVALRTALIDGINENLRNPVVEQLYFTEFVVQ